MNSVAMITHNEPEMSRNSRVRPGKRWLQVLWGLTASALLHAAAGGAVARSPNVRDRTDGTMMVRRGSSGSDTSTGSRFHTPADSTRSFRFIAYGDNRSGDAAHQSVINQMLLANPAPLLMVNVGDLTSKGSAAEYRTFFDIEHAILSSTPMFPCVGNHDTGDMANWHTNFTLPNNELWYTFRYGNTVFHNLDCYSAYTPGSPQYNWFLSELLADSSDAGVRHIVVSFHEPPYTTCASHASDLAVRRDICPLLERFHVRLTFQGHNHVYEHSLVNNVHYITTGGGGAPLYDDWGPPEPWTVFRESTYEFVLVDVRSDTLVVKAVKPGGTVIDSFQVVDAAGNRRR